tara:strand:- start:257 stop:841 length:585 start_codon:yes stop_codon:yes gene_type:complete
MKNSDFHQRMASACDRSANVPPYGRGRQTVITNAINVSHESTRKYFLPKDNGGSVPKAAKLKELAKFLGVDESWLALGIEPDMTQGEKRQFSADSSGSVYIAFGIITAAGATCAFSDEDDADFIYIMRGQSEQVKIVVGVEKSKNVFNFDVSHSRDSVRVMGMIKRSSTSFDIIDLPFYPCVQSMVVNLVGQLE